MLKTWKIRVMDDKADKAANVDLEIWNHLPMADKIAVECGVDPTENIDTILATLNSAKESFKERKGSTFRQYARVCLRRAFINLTRSKAYRESSRLTANATDLEEMGSETYSSSLGGFAYARFLKDLRGQNNENTVIDIDKVCNQLAPIEALIIQRYYVEEKTIEEIGIELGINRQSTHARLKRILAKCSDYLNNSNKPMT
jgi:RNA polymerase sigma factor (sigma-70 family)